MIDRQLTRVLQDLAGQYPVVAVTGPRQSGKTTLVQAAFVEHEYVLLEDPDQRAFALEDPRRFLEAHEGPVILDEVHRVPELFSYLQGRIDENPRPGRFVLTGSNNFLLHEGISQSLAGRVALLTLLPFSLGELKGYEPVAAGLEANLHTGFYPRIHEKGLSPSRWYAGYVDTYLERDVRRLLNVSDLGRFQLFLRHCAARAGQLVNLSSLGNDCGITFNTARSWLSVLEASYVIRLLRPFHTNFGKRLVKAPKLHFLDPGLLSYLLEIDSPRELLTHSSRGAVFETLVFAELLKARLNAGLPERLYFWRDYAGHEVDFVWGTAASAMAIEAKSGKTITRDSFKGLRYWASLHGTNAPDGIVVYGGDESHQRRAGRVLSWRDLPTIPP